MATASKFRSLSNLPKVEPSASGKDIYEWEYLNRTGVLKHDKKNVYESIQSFKNQTDYKKRIEEGETFDNGNGIYLDTTKFNGDYGDLDEYFASLASSIRSQINPEDNGTTRASATVEPNEKIAEVVKTSASNPSESGAVDNGTKGIDGK